MTRFCIITDEARHIKWLMLIQCQIPLISVNRSCWCFANLDNNGCNLAWIALTHAPGSYVSIAATLTSQILQLIKVIELVQAHLRTAVALASVKIHWSQEQMVYARSSWLAWHSTTLLLAMFMQWRTNWVRFLRPSTRCNVILLPHVQRYNAQVCPGCLRMLKSTGVKR